MWSLLLLLSTPAPAQDDPPRLRTDRPLQVDLPLPEEDDAFLFAVFGDRTGGPPEGVSILRDAVRDVNLIDPDLVMTVGDLIQGYNQTPTWMKDMREYKEIMGNLTSPWFPVAGNHDTYWRGPDRPEGEHDANYEQHFGPLWYVFDHKGSTFVVLYTDEGNPETGEKNFGKAECQRMSPEQFAFLDKTLTEAKDSKHVFVFLHHPRWHGGRYGDDWNRVHERLAAAGNVSAVFAGHIHRMVYDGPRDGIEYFTLATVGGGQSSIAPEAGYLHHYDLVTVRDEGISVASYPVGAAIDPRRVTAKVSGDARTLAGFTAQEGERPSLQGNGRVDGTYALLLENPIDSKVEVDMTLGSQDSRWSFTPNHGHLTLEPGESRTVYVRALRVPSAIDETLRFPEVTWNLDLLTEDARFHIPTRTQGLGVGLENIDEPAPSSQALAVRGGADHLKIEHADLAFPDGPFTVEGYMRAQSFADRVGLFCKTESSEFALFVSKGVPEFDVHLDNHYVIAKRDGLQLETGKWIHLAGVFDGKELRLYVDGKLVASAAGSGPRTFRSIPLILGADVDGSGRANSPFHGDIDEFRLSSVARYTEDFEPAARHEPDADTHLLLHFDGAIGPWVFDSSPRRLHPRRYGAPTFVDGY